MALSTSVPRATAADSVEQASPPRVLSPHAARPFPTARRPAAPYVAAAKFNGLAAADSGCTCPAPDVAVAVGAAQIVEAVDSTIAVYSRTGTRLTSSSLISMFPGSGGVLRDPELSYDPGQGRFILVASRNNPATAPQLVVAASTSADATAGWTYYGVSLPGSAGYTATNPQLGQDLGAIAVTTDLFDETGTYQQSLGVTFAKAQVFHSKPAQRSDYFHVQQRTAPAVVSQSPMDPDSTLYLLSADAYTGLHVYFLRNAATPLKTKLIDQGIVPLDFGHLPADAPQPGTSVTLPTTDAFTSPPSQLDGRVWWTHTTGNASYSEVTYGYLNTSSLVTHYGFAFHSATSFDFGPSIVATRYSGTTPHAVLNWTFTDPANGVSASAAYALVSGTQFGTTKTGTVYTAAVANSTAAAYSPTAVSADYTAVGSCPAGAYATVASEYYAADGTWKTRLARVGPSC